MDIQKLVEAKKQSKEWQLYEQLMQKRPWEFANVEEVAHEHDALKIVKDIEVICTQEIIHDRKAGVLYCSPYSMMVVDLVQAADGKYFFYERSLPAIAESAVVCLTVCKGRYILLKQFRHSMRGYQYACVRGFAEPNLSSLDNAVKEVSEELNAHVTDVQYLGKVVADSGHSGNMVDVYRCVISDWQTLTGHEGIQAVVALTKEELIEYIASGKLTDSYTLSALALECAIIK